MKRHPKRNLPKPRLGFVVFLLLTLTGCTKPTPIRLPSQEIITRTASRMKGLDGFHFLIQREGAPAYLDYAGTIAFRRAEGDFVSPDQAQATVRVITPGLVAEIRIIALAENYWETNLLTGEWQALPPNMGFNPAVLFDPVIGFQSILESDLFNLTLQPDEELEEAPGKTFYVLAGDLKGERLYEMSYGMIGPDQLTVKMWVDPGTFDLYRTLITDPPAGAGESTLWQVDFWDFGKVADIRPPEVKEP